MNFKFFQIFIAVFFLSVMQLPAQSNAWVDMFSYLKVKHLQAVPPFVYAQSDNTFFMYNTDSGEIEKLSTVNGLTGDPVSNFYYHKDLKKLFVFHEGGLIEIIDAQKKVFRSPELAYNTFIPSDKKVLNNIFPDGNRLYLATKYGITVYNFERNEFGDTYYIDSPADYLNVYDVQIAGQTIYAATDHGLYSAASSDNLIDQTAWHKIDNRAWHDLVMFNQVLYGVQGSKLYKITGQNLQNVLSFSQSIRSLTVHNFLVVNLSHKIMVYDSNLMSQMTIDDTAFTNEYFYDAFDFDNRIWIGSNKHGVLKYALNQSAYEALHPDSPLSNHAFAVDAREGILWLAYGDHFELNPYPLYKEGLSSYQNKAWVNIPYEDFQISDVSFVKINPTNTNEVYFSSPKNGLIRVRNNQIDRIFNQTNSPLTMLGTDGVRVFATDFDSKNNLWVSHTPSPALVKHKPDDTWESVDLSSVLSNFAVNHGTPDLVVGKEDVIYMATEYFGLLAYNPENHQIATLQEGLQTTAYPDIQTIAIDKNNIMWVGNRDGLRILPNPEEIFTDPQKEFKPIKIVYEDAVQLLMEGQNITDITVDGSNNKWFATLGSGVYYYNEDGTEMIYHFTKENSPLPSNNIYNIAVDGSNGMVYFATLNGLIGYKGFATEGGDNMDDVYAFPNPANEKEHQFVTIRGLIKDVDVKIVDVEGNLVYETVSKGGSVQWDLTAFGKYKVASGVYIALITNEDGSKTQTTKILVIK